MRDQYEGREPERASGPRPSAAALRTSVDSVDSGPQAAPATPELLRPFRRAANADLQSAAKELNGVSDQATAVSEHLADHGAEGRLADGLNAASSTFQKIATAASAAATALPEGRLSLTELKDAGGAMQERIAVARERMALARGVMQDVGAATGAGQLWSAATELGAMGASLDRADALAGRAVGRTLLAGDVADVAELPAGAPQQTPAGSLTADDLRKLGSALPPDGGPQMMWMRNDGFPEPAALAGTQMQRAQEQGLLSPEQQSKSSDAANRALPGQSVQEFTAADVAAMAKDAGIPLERVDPNQLQQASRLINSAKEPQEQRDRIALSVNLLSVAANGKAPELNRSDMVNMLWAEARIPGHALTKLSDADLRARVADVTRATNTPGEHQLKVGDHNVNLTVSDDGSLKKTETKKPGFWSRLGTIAKIGLAAASFIPGPIGLAARAVNGVVSMVGAIRQGSVFGAVTAGLGAIAAGAGAIAGRATSGLAYATSRVAGGLSRVVSGAQSVVNGIRNGSLTAGLTGLANVAGGLSDGLGGLGQGLQNASQRLGNVSRFINGANQAQQAISAARRGDLGTALAQGFAGAANMSGALGQTDLAAQLSRYSNWSAAANGIYQSARHGDYLQAAGALSRFAAGTVVQDPETAQHLKDLGTVLTGAGELSRAVKDGDWLSAAAAGTEIASALTGNGTATRADLEGATRTLDASVRLRNAIRTGDENAIGAALYDLQDTVRQEVTGFSERHAPARAAARTPGVMEPAAPRKTPQELAAAVRGLSGEQRQQLMSLLNASGNLRVSDTANDAELAQAFDRILQSNSMFSSGQRALLGLLDSGRLDATLENGQTVLSFLSRNAPATGRPDPLNLGALPGFPPERAQQITQNLLAQLMEDVADPARGIGQRDNTCSLTSSQYMLARSDPSAYTQMMVELVRDGRTTTPGGNTLRLDPDLASRVLARGGTTDDLFAAALFFRDSNDQRKPDEYGNAGWWSRNTAFGDGGYIDGSLDAPRNERQTRDDLDFLFGRGSYDSVTTRLYGDGDAVNLIRRVTDGGQPVSVHLNYFGGAGGGHQVVVHGVRDGQVYFYNPNGGAQQAGMMPGVKPAGNGLYSVSMEEFQSRLRGVVYPAK